MKIFGVDFTEVELRGIYTMACDLPSPNIGSKEAYAGLRKLESIVKGRFCRYCTDAGVVKSKRGFYVCTNHKTIHD